MSTTLTIIVPSWKVGKVEQAVRVAAMNEGVESRITDGSVLLVVALVNVFVGADDEAVESFTRWLKDALRASLTPNIVTG